MQNRSYSNHSFSTTVNPAKPLSGSTSPIKSDTRPSSLGSPRPTPKPAGKSFSKKDELTRIFNTALVSSQAGVKRDFSRELNELTESAPFKAVLNAVRQLACVQGVSEREAAEEIIKTFRKLDEIWDDYIMREGIERLRRPRP